MTESSKQKAAGLKFENLTLRLRGKLILDRITAEVPPGGATVIVGPNGAGKTSLLRCFLGEAPYSGKIVYIDEKGAEISGARIGYVPQQLQADASLPLTVREFLCLRQKRPLWLGCSREGREKSREMLRLVGAEKLENQRMGSLSGGETRRILLASALGRKPEILVLDEAEAGVDYRGERLFWELLDKSRKEFGFTLMMVSHNLPLAAHYATHVIAIKQRLLAEGSPRRALTSANLLSLFGAPIHLYPAQCDNPGSICLECGAFGNPPHSGALGGDLSGRSDARSA